MEDINAKILQQGFGIKLISAYRTRTGLVCKTDRGMLELKKTYADDESLEREYILKEYLKARGMNGVDISYRTTEDMPCYRMDENAYVLIKYIPARRLDMEDNSDISEAASALAFFHNAAEGFVDNTMRRTYGSLEQLFEKRLNEFSRIRRKIKNDGNYSAIDLLIMKYYDYYTERINMAEELLKKSDYLGVSTAAEKAYCVCHNSFKNDNVRITENGNIIISGLDGCTYDLSILDLAHLIRKYIKSGNADEYGISLILENYSRYRSITSAESDVVKGMLIYPYKFLKLCNEHYNKRRLCISEAAVERFENCIAGKDREMRLVRSI